MAQSLFEAYFGASLSAGAPAFLSAALACRARPDLLSKSMQVANEIVSGARKRVLDWPGVKLYIADIEGFGEAEVVARSAARLDERIEQAIGLRVRSVQTAEDAAAAKAALPPTWRDRVRDRARKDPAPGQ